MLEEKKKKHQSQRKASYLGEKNRPRRKWQSPTRLIEEELREIRRTQSKQAQSSKKKGM